MHAHLEHVPAIPDLPTARRILKQSAILIGPEKITEVFFKKLHGCPRDKAQISVKRQPVEHKLDTTLHISAFKARRNSACG